MATLHRQRGRPIYLVIWCWAAAALSGTRLRAGPGFANAQTVPTDAEVLFTFDRSQCLAGSIQDSSGGGQRLLGSLLVATPGQTCLASGEGVRSTATPPQEQLASNGTAAQYAALVDQSMAFSLELWLRPPAVLPTAGNFHIVSFDFPESATVPGALSTPALGVVVEEGRILRLRMAYEQVACAAMQFDLRMATAGAMLHMVATCYTDPLDIDLGLICSLYVNGRAVEKDWAGCRFAVSSNSRLFFYSVPTGMRLTGHAPWAGGIHLFALYDRGLSATEIQARFNARVPNSRPVATDATLQVQKNGEVGTHYDTPKYYLSPVPVLELATLALRAQDADEDPASPNYNASAPLHRIRLASLPTKGTLYLLDGTEITAAPTPVPRSNPLPGDNFTTPTAYVRFRPIWGETSAPNVYTSFTFVAIDGVTGLASDPATLRVIVTPTHTIPVASTNITARAQAGVPVVITLSGTAHGGATIVGASITALPVQGQLYQVHPSNGSVAIASDPIALPAGGGGRTALWGLAVGYVYTGPQGGALGADGTLATDGFGFAVRDDRNANSVEAPVTVDVQTALVAVAGSTDAGGEGIGGTEDEAFRVLEGHPSPLMLSAVDALPGFLEPDAPPREVCFEIDVLPRHGLLYQLTGAESSVPITDLGTVVPGAKAQSLSGGRHRTVATVVYISVPGFFNVPRTAWGGGPLTGQEEEGDADEQEAFAYRAVACDDPTVSSPPVAQPIVVRNVNDRTVVTLDEADFTVYPTLFPGNATAAGPYPTQLRLHGVTVLDPDRGADPVLVRIACRFGSLALDAAAAALADFNSTRYCQTTCLRRTFKLLAFVASPAALETIFGGLTYATTLPRIQDTVTISVHDGVGGACLAPGAVPTLSDTSAGCFVHEAQFRVASRNFAIVDQFAEETAASRGKSRLPYILAGMGIAFLATLLLCVYMCCCGGAAAAARLCCPVHPAESSTAAAAAAPVSPGGLGETMTRPLVD